MYKKYISFIISSILAFSMVVPAYAGELDVDDNEVVLSEEIITEGSEYLEDSLIVEECDDVLVEDELTVRTPYADTCAPTVSDIKLSKDTVYTTADYDEFPEVIVGITDDKSGIKSAEVEFYSAANDASLYAFLEETYYEYNPETGKGSDKKYADGKFHAKVGAYDMPLGEYKIHRITVYDNAGNCLEYVGKNIPSQFSSISITCDNPYEGFEPTLTSIGFKKNSLTLPGNVEMTATATSNLSGISVKMIEVGIKTEDGRSATIYLHGSAGNLSGSYDFSNSYDYAGKWTIDSISIVGQSLRTYQNVNKKFVRDNLPSCAKGKSITLKAVAKKGSAPTVTGVRFSSDEVIIKKGSKKATVNLIVNAQKGSSDISKIDVTLKNTKSTDTISSYAYGNGIVSTFTVPFEISAYEHPGKYVVQEIIVWDFDGNARKYIDSDKKGNADFKYEKLTSQMREVDLTISNDSIMEGYHYKIAYDANGGTGTTKDQNNIANDKKIKLRANGFNKKGYHFVGWNTIKDGSGKSYKDKASVKNLTVKDGVTVTLYAQWEINTYKIKYNGNGATSGKMSTNSGRKYGKKYNLSANKYKKKGYKFAGWATSKKNASKGKVKYKDKASVKNLTGENNKTVTLYAVWK